jgi:uncharacterized damage-inducible protein DinB
MRAGTTVSGETQMPVRDLLLPELELEGSFTRKHLERVPMTSLGFKPHSKSMTLGELSTFLAVIPTWGLFALATDSLDVAPGGEPLPQPEVVRSHREMLEMFDRNMIGLRAALTKASDPHLQKPWSLIANGSALFTQPRYLIYRTLFLNHMIHHRAQLGTYFRLLGVRVPAVYNDSGDEKGGMFMN